VTAYWIAASIQPSAKIHLQDCYIANSAKTPEGHLQVVEDIAFIRNVTLFAGHLTFWGAIKWGILGLLRLGPNRVNRIKRIFNLNKKGD